MESLIRSLYELALDVAQAEGERRNPFSSEQLGANSYRRASLDNLALMLGVSRPTLNKELQALAKMGVISLHYGHVEIKNMGLLIGGGNPL
jgi:hypothetical protein